MRRECGCESCRETLLQVNRCQPSWFVGVLNMAIIWFLVPRPPAEWSNYETLCRIVDAAFCYDLRNGHRLAHVELVLRALRRFKVRCDRSLGPSQIAGAGREGQIGVPRVGLPGAVELAATLWWFLKALTDLMSCSRKSILVFRVGPSSTAVLPEALWSFPWIVADSRSWPKSHIGIRPAGPPEHGGASIGVAIRCAQEPANIARVVSIRPRETCNISLAGLPPAAP